MDRPRNKHSETRQNEVEDRPDLVRSAAPLAWASWPCSAAPPAAFRSPPAAVYTTRCSSCHSFGMGDRIGPDLKGVTARRSRAWLIEWIQSSEAKIRSGDATASALYRKYGRQRMPDFDLPVERITALLDYLASGGPAADAANAMRDAATATPR